MADDNDDSWLYGGGPDDVSRRDEERELENAEETEPVKNGNLENKTFETTFDEHNFEVRLKNCTFWSFAKNPDIVLGSWR